MSITTEKYKIVRGLRENAYALIDKYTKEGYVYTGSKGDTQNIELYFKKCKIKPTNIEFHKGDFVEDKYGNIGYVSRVCHCDACKERGFFEPTIEYCNGTEDYISNHAAKNIVDNYKQIGTQRFDENFLRKRIIELERQLGEMCGD